MNERLVNTIVQVLPVFAMLAAGYFFKRRSILSRDAVASVKRFVATLSLPAVVFGAFSSVKLDRLAGITFVAIFAACSIALAIGLSVDALRKRKSPQPFLMTAFEAGMLGLPLFGILYGTKNIPVIALADLGEICFTFLILIPLMNSRSGGERGAKAALRRLVGNPVIWAVVLGLIGAATGASRLLRETGAGRAISSCLAFAGAPTGALILFVVGYDLDFSRKNLGAAIPTIGLRYLVMVPLLFAVRAVVIALGGRDVDPILLAAIGVLFVMPPSFAIPIFGKGGEESEYIATTLSLNTLVSVAILAVMSALS